MFYQILYTIAYFLFLNLLKLSSLFIKLYLVFIYLLIFRVFNNLAAVVGKGAAEKAILSSKRWYTAKEALDIGMMDKVVPKEKLIDEAKSQLNELTVFSGEKCS